MSKKKRKKQVYKFKTIPYNHQVEALKKLISNGWGGALLMEPRTGKTKVGVDYASILHERGKADRVLIVCPVAVMDVWVQEIATHCPVDYRVLVWDKRARKTKPLPKFGSGKLDFVIINYDAFSAPGAITSKVTDEEGKTVEIRRSKKRGGRYTLKQQIQDWQPHLIILDESHRIKSSSAAKTRMILSTQWRRKRVGSEYELVPLAPYRVIATGTAVTKAKRVFDLYAQWRFLNPESPLVKGHTAESFKAEYGRWTTRNGYPQFLSAKNQGTLHRLLHEEAYAVTRDECFDLPAAYPPQLIRVPLEESAPVYDQMAEEMVALIRSGEVTEASIRLVQILRFCQITSGIARTAPSELYPEGRLVRVGSEKLRYLEELFADYFDQEEKLVVCARFRGDITSIARLARAKFRITPQILMGGMTRTEKTKAITDFRRRSGPALFIMNPQAGSLGIDLRTASTMIWYSLTSSYVDYTQSLDRIALSGKANRFIYLLGKGTYDEELYKALQEDADVVKAIHKRPEILLRRDT